MLHTPHIYPDTNSTLQLFEQGCFCFDINAFPTLIFMTYAAASNILLSIIQQVRSNKSTDTTIVAYKQFIKYGCTNLCSIGEYLEQIPQITTHSIRL